LILLMETEIWPRLIHEAHRNGTSVAIVNGRLSPRSYGRYSMVRFFVRDVLNELDLALMQNVADAERITKLGIEPTKVRVTGNLKFDHSSDDRDITIASELREHFGISDQIPLIVAASTHEPEEKLILDSLQNVTNDFRLLIAPRHPRRFDHVAAMIKASGRPLTRRSETAEPSGKTAKVILLDTIGELRAAYRLADIVFVGGSLIPHGGQSILEPAAAGKAIVTGPYTHNFEAVVSEFKRREAVIQIAANDDQSALVDELAAGVSELLNDAGHRDRLGQNAAQAMRENEGAAKRTVESLSGILRNP
jgi:3-deoxy-D-manno-octulosonic-acid transferase